MKHLFFMGFALLAFTRLAHAHTFFPPTLETVANSDAIYLVHVTTIKERQKDALGPPIVFSVTEILRGKPMASLSLTVYEAYDFKENGEYILVHQPGGFKNRVGYCLAGDSEWFPIEVTREGNKATAQWLGPLDQVRDYLKQHPAKP